MNMCLKEEKQNWCGKLDSCFPQILQDLNISINEYINCCCYYHSCPICVYRNIYQGHQKSVDRYNALIMIDYKNIKFYLVRCELEVLSWQNLGIGLQF